MPGKFKFEPRTTALTRDDVNQLNKQFDLIEQAIRSVPRASSAPPVSPPSPQPIATSVNVADGMPGAGVASGSGAKVVTDGTTISGDGDSTPIALVIPVALANGGTGLGQTGTQQITTNGTAIAAGTAQAQPVASIAGVTAQSAAMWSLPNVPDATWQTGIFGILVCNAGTVTLYLVNPTAASITPIAQLVNIKAIL